MADVDSREWFEQLRLFKESHPEVCSICRETLCGYGGCQMLIEKKVA